MNHAWCSTISFSSSAKVFGWFILTQSMHGVTLADDYSVIVLHQGCTEKDWLLSREVAQITDYIFKYLLLIVWGTPALYVCHHHFQTSLCWYPAKMWNASTHYLSIPFIPLEANILSCRILLANIMTAIGITHSYY